MGNVQRRMYISIIQEMMKKNVFAVLAIIMLAVPSILVSCDDEETYAEQKEREHKQIDEFISKNGIDVISMTEFLKDSITDNPDCGPDKTRNEYVLFPDKGVYMQIVRKGEGREMKSGESWNMNARYVEVYIPTSDTMTMNLFNTYPEQFNIVRTTDSYAASFSYGIMMTKYGSAVPKAWLMAFPFIRPGFMNGESAAKVRMIVPHDQGTKTAASNVYPSFYEISISTEKWQ